MEQLPEAASVGNRAPTDGGGVSGGVLSSASDDDGGGFKSAMRQQLSKRAGLHHQHAAQHGARSRARTWPG